MTTPTSLYLSPLNTLQSSNQPVTLEDMESSYTSVLKTLGPSSSLSKIHASTMASYDTACCAAIATSKTTVSASLSREALNFGGSLGEFTDLAGRVYDREVEGWRGSRNNGTVDRARVKGRVWIVNKARSFWNKANKAKGNGGRKRKGMEEEVGEGDVDMDFGGEEEPVENNTKKGKGRSNKASSIKASNKVRKTKMKSTPKTGAASVAVTEGKVEGGGKKKKDKKKKNEVRLD